MNNEDKVLEENNLEQEVVDNNVETITDNIIESSVSLSDIDYLDSKILQVKEYSYEEINNLEESQVVDKDFDENIYSKNLSDISEKTVVKGSVVAIDDKDVIVDIGFKSEGIIPRNEFSSIPQLGQEIDVFLITFEDRRGNLILSKEKAEFECRWQELRDAFKNDSILTGKITKRIKGGMVVDLGVVNAFLPGSQLDVKTVTDFDQFINMECELKIVKFNEFRQNIVVSRKAVMSTDLNDKKKEFLENLEVGIEIDGIVKNITDFGAFIDLGGGIDGLLHITDITWGRINHPSDRLKLGDDIKVKVIDYDNVKNRVSLGLKQLSQDPWVEALKKYDVGSIVKGKLVNIMNYGVFLEIEEGIEGLIHISEMSWYKHVKHPSDMYKMGDEIEAKVLSIDQETKKISLGIKQLEDNPWDSINDKFKEGDKCTGTVDKFTQNGAFVEIEENTYGFLNLSDISWTRKIKHPSDLLAKGQEVEVTVLNVLADDRKINLGMKQLVEDPWMDIDNLFKVNSNINGTVLLVLEKGIIFLLDNNFEGILPISKVNDKTQFSVKDSHELEIVEINKDNRRIVLNLSKNNEALDKSEEESNTESEEKESN